MKVNQAFHYALDPTEQQRSLLAQSVSTARYAFHGGLALCKRLLDAGNPVPHAVERGETATVLGLRCLSML